MTGKNGVMICGHGSRDEDAVREFKVLSEALIKRFPDMPVEYGYLEFATPIIKEGLAKLTEAGVSDVLAVPAMLFAAGHAKNDIPSVLNRYQAEHAGLNIHYGSELGLDIKMTRAAGERVREALSSSNSVIDPAETLLMVVGRGSSDPDANSNVSKLTRQLWEGLGFGWAETCYSGVTFPLVEPGLEHATRLGFKRIVVFPYFLFTGVLVKRIYEHADIVAARHPEIEFIKAGYLNDHPLVLDTLAERVSNILSGDNNMNCQQCKYREQILGFEDQVGLPQDSHHHHVEGIGTGDGHNHDHDHAHDHDHSHDHGHHHPYPHADHPLGPRTLKRI